MPEVASDPLQVTRKVALSLVAGEEAREVGVAFATFVPRRRSFSPPG